MQNTNSKEITKTETKYKNENKNEDLMRERWIDTFLQKTFNVKGITFETIDILFVANYF